MNIARRLSSSALLKLGWSTRPSICWRRNSYQASREPSDLPEKRRKRIPLEERKAMVESYVHKYRAMNSGKFPSPTEAKRQVGGSYYIIRKLIEELQHQAKISTTSTMKAYTEGEVIKDGNRFSGTHQPSTSVMTTYDNIHQDGETRDGNESLKDAATLSSVQLPFFVTVQEEKPTHRDVQASPEKESAKNDTSGHEVEEIRFFQPESDVKNAENSCDSAASNLGSDLPRETNAKFIQTTLSEKMETPSSPGDTTQVANVIDDKLKVETADFQQYFHKDEDNPKMQEPPELDKLKPEPESEKLHQSHKLGTVTRDLSKHHTEDAALEKKSNMWDNLKSFAGGIFSFFRKQ